MLKLMLLCNLDLSKLKTCSPRCCQNDLGLEAILHNDVAHACQVVTLQLIKLVVTDGLEQYQ